MKRLSLVTAIASLLLSLAGSAIADEETTVIRLSEPVESTADYETFGAALDESLENVSLATLAEGGESYLGEPVLVTARVSQVCQKKGCFFIAQEGGTMLRVSFKDYGFFVPTDISGRRVTMVGELVEREISEEQAEHMSEDLGDAGAMQAGVVYEIVATSVRVPRG